jgi:hypothetical protein
MMRIKVTEIKQRKVLIFMGMGHENLGNAYLYRFYKGVLQVYFGQVISIKGTCNNRGMFYVNEKGKSIGDKSFSVSEHEGAIYKGMIWLREENEKKAATLFRNYYLERYRDLKLKMTKIDNIIDILDWKYDTLMED